MISLCTQTCLKYGTEEDRNLIYAELRSGLTVPTLLCDSIRYTSVETETAHFTIVTSTHRCQDLTKAKYGRVIVKKLFMYCPKPVKAEIVNEKVLLRSIGA